MIYIAIVSVHPDHEGVTDREAFTSLDRQAVITKALAVKQRWEEKNRKSISTVEVVRVLVGGLNGEVELLPPSPPPYHIRLLES